MTDETPSPPEPNIEPWRWSKVSSNTILLSLGLLILGALIFCGGCLTMLTVR